METNQLTQYMTITINSSSIPILITIILLIVMFRPYGHHGDYDFGFIFRLFWLIPICVTWLIYVGVLLWVQTP